MSLGCLYRLFYIYIDMNLKRIKDAVGQVSDVANIAGSLFGCIVRLKEIHYSSSDMDTHTLSDDLIGMVRSFEDKYSEVVQNQCASVGIGDLVVLYPEAYDLGGVIDVLQVIVESAQSNPDVAMMCAEFIEDLKQIRYRNNIIISKVQSSPVGVGAVEVVVSE